VEAVILRSSEFDRVLADSAHVAGEVQMLREICKPGMVAMDVGAHGGISTLVLADAAGPEGSVWAFEPVPEYFDALRMSVAGSGFGNTRTYRLALSDHCCGVGLYKHGSGSGIVPAEEAERLPVPADTLDHFKERHGIARLDVLSADCEGSELDLFEGAAETLRNDGPRIFCEIHHGYLADLGLSARDVARYLTGFGYEVQPLRSEDLTAKVALEDCTHIKAIRAD
jgi:FkbM family methyltransferase